MVPALLARAGVTGEAANTTAIPTEAQIQAAIRRGVEFLLHDQNPDGSWGSAHRTKDLNIYAPVPGAHQAFRAAVTALCVQALIETGAAEQSDAANQALQRGETWLLEHLPELRRATPDALYNVWSHAYGIQALVAMHRRAAGDAERQQRIRAVIESQFDRLRRYESVDGGWGYYDFRVGTQRPASDPTSFTTATALVAFHQAKQIGIEPPADLVQRAIRCLHRQRKPDHTYLYAEDHRWRPMWEINRAGGSLGRSQACNLALRYWGDATITDAVLSEWLDRLVTRNGWLSIGRKRPVPHESWFLVAGYFFYYGHYYAALCAEELPDAAAASFQRRLAAILLPLQETDGSWWDYPLYNYHQQYGTAFALMTLVHCR